MKKCLIALYIAGSFLTNSYIRQYRLPEWNKTSLAELNTYTGINKSHVDQAKTSNDFSCFGATILWPIYIASRLSDLVMRTNVKVEASDVLKNL